MGSVHYTSPEQARGGYSDAKSDIYSLGIVMYEMVTGRVPFDGETTVVVAVKHLQEDMVSPRVYVSDIPVSLEHIILKCTEKSPDRRYPNVAELIADLKQSLLTPDVNFVKEIVPDGAKTVAITRDEISKIKKETGRLPLDEDDAESRYAYLDEMNDEYDDEEYDEDYDEDYDGEYDDDEYEEDEDDEYDDDEREGGALDPKLEKIMTIGGIVAAVIIIIIVVVLVSKMFGFGKSGGKDKDKENDKEISDVLEENAEVPDLLGMSYSEAKEALNKLGLGIKLGETRSSDEYDAGQIISQSEEAGTEVGANTTIVVDICGDGEKVEVPDVTGKSQAKAESALKEAGLSADVSEVYSDEVSAGKVISTSPSAGKKIERGSVVQVVVSKGKEEDAQIEVPDIRNSSESSAKQKLSDKGLASGTVTQEFSDSVEEGKVISQNPSAGTKVEKGSKVSYVISKGKENKDVYIGNAEKDGSTESAVTNYLTSRGLKVERSEAYSDTVPKGNVISYKPGNGSTVPAGSTVKIVVSLGPETAEVPNLSGMTAEQAKVALPSAFKWGGASNGDVAPDYTKNGLVYWQSHSGTQNQGTSVSVKIYASVPNCGDGNHTQPSGAKEGDTVKCSKCGATFTIPVTTPTTPDPGTQPTQ